MESSDSYTDINSLSDIINIDCESRIIANKIVETKVVAYS
jgi:1-deoxy-D-xylulose-5-phosphate reductoisomerase